jgi:tetratricopeptide (TPR) repeat protein
MWSAKTKAVAILVASSFAASPMVVSAQQSNSKPDSSSQNSSSPSSPQDDNNSFPEDVSRKAAADKKKAEQQPPESDTGSDQNTGSDKNAPPAKPSGDDNAFPEETSRKAADAAKAASSGSGDSESSSSSGSSSSSDYDRRTGGRTAVPTNVPMPHVDGKDPVKEDVSVGSYYLQAGNYKGAYQRFKEASVLSPENTDAMFGLAEAARHLNKRDEALANYQLFLEVVSSGSKAKDARKAVASLEKDK